MVNVMPSNRKADNDHGKTVSSLPGYHGFACAQIQGVGVGEAAVKKHQASQTGSYRIILTRKFTRLRQVFFFLS